MTGKIALLTLAVFLGGKNVRESGYSDVWRYVAGSLIRGQYTENGGFGVSGGTMGTWGKNPFLILVNKDNPLPEGYQVRLRRAVNGACDVSEDIFSPLRQMLEDGKKEGLQFVVASGYRDAAYQQGLLDEDIRNFMAGGMDYEEAYAEATKDTMPAGYSEHSTGLAVDIVSASYQMLNDGLENTPEIQWLQENCAKYGFILRYPRGKEDITKIIYESWHFRYVGVKAAKEIQSRGITLEEYVWELQEAEKQKEAREREESETESFTDQVFAWEKEWLGQIRRAGETIFAEAADSLEEAMHGSEQAGRQNDGKQEGQGISASESRGPEPEPYEEYKKRRADFFRKYVEANSLPLEKYLEGASETLRDSVELISGRFS